MSRRIRVLIACVLLSVPVAAVGARSAGGTTPRAAGPTASARPSSTIVELSWAGHRQGSVAHALGFTTLPGSFFVFLTCMIAAYLVLIELAKARYFPSSHRRDRAPQVRFAFRSRSALARASSDGTKPRCVSI